MPSLHSARLGAAASDAESAAGPPEAYRQARVGWMPWKRQPEDVTGPAQRRLKAELAAVAGAEIADDAFVAPDARIFTETLVMGPRSWIASHALVRGEIRMGADCTVNPYACLSGRVTLGDGVRIASLATLVGFNHRSDDPELPVYRQGVETRGITVGDDVWIGANAVLVDGVTIGSHSIVAAGAVVSRDVPPWSVVGGVPARVLRDRRRPAARDEQEQTAFPAPAPRSPEGEAERALAALDERAREQWPAVIEAARSPAAPGFTSVDAFGRCRPTARHLCDAVELAAGFGQRPPGLDQAAAVEWLQGVQDPTTGLFPDPFQPPAPGTPQHSDPLALYNVLAVGYALECLGAAPLHPVAAFEEMSGQALCAWLEALPWRERAWGAGAGVDALGTALYFNRRYYRSGRALETVMGWLALRVDPVTGLWGSPTPDGAMLQPVNGFYRLTRGTYAQFGLALPAAEAAIDTVLAHRRHYRGFQGEHYNACNLLDVAHPLWLCLKQTDHRREEVRAAIAAELARACGCWREGRGFAFGSGQEPGLQGTEMWLSTIYLMADILGLAPALSFEPRGVHRTEPVGRATLGPSLSQG